MNSGLVWRLGLVLLVLSSGKIFAASITGSAAYRERIALPPDATLEATMEDVSRVDAPPQSSVGSVSCRRDRYPSNSRFLTWSPGYSHLIGIT